jgi:PIN domain nuclease of toxin-antitoxin system
MAVGAADQMSRAAAEALRDAAATDRLLISAASVWEIALKSAKGTLRISTDLHAWVGMQRKRTGLRVLPLSPAVLIDATLLPPWIRRGDAKEHKDPNDRFIVATARRRNAVLVTCDREILDYAGQGHVTVFDARP